MEVSLVKRSDERQGEHFAARPASGMRSTWRYFPHALLVTFGTVAAPLASVELMQSMTGQRPIVLSLVLAVGLSAAIASAGSWLWQRRPGSRDILFGDLMLWGWLRRLRTEHRLQRAAKLLDGAAAGGPDADAHDRERQIEILERLARTLDARDPYTHGHSHRVARNAHMIASRMGLPAEQVAKVRVAAAVHDAGKIAIDRSILNKPSALSDEEFEVVKRHPGDGAEMLASLGDPEIVAMVRHHHERLDGSGYPDGLTGDDIPLGARIIAVADTFDAITSVRPYRRPRKQHVALKILKEEAGTRLDAEAVGVFLTYYTARRTAAWSSLVLAVPERLLGLLSGGAGPIAQGAAATVAAASIGGALIHPVLDTQPEATAKTAVVQQVAQRTASDGPAGASGGAGAAQPRSEADRRRRRASHPHRAPASAREDTSPIPDAGAEVGSKARGGEPGSGSNGADSEVAPEETAVEPDGGADKNKDKTKTDPASGGGGGSGNSGSGQSGSGNSNANSGQGNANGNGNGGGSGGGSSGGSGSGGSDSGKKDKSGG